MSAPKLSPVPDTGPASALAAARAEHACVVAALDRISQEVARIEEAAAPAAAAAATASTLRQKRVTVLATLLRLGRRVDAAPELKAIDHEIDTAGAEQIERSAADVAAAKASVLDSLQADAAELRARLTEARKAVELATFETVGEEILVSLAPTFREAADKLGAAYAALAAGGRVHSELARRLREKYGINVQPMGTTYPPTSLDLVAIGFGSAIENVGQFNVRHIDATAGIEAAFAASLRRWQSA